MAMLRPRPAVDLEPAHAARTTRPAPHRAQSLAAAALLLFVTLAIRVWGIPNGGLLYWDEGWAARDGRLLIGTILRPEGWMILVRHFTYQEGDWKPVHDLLLGSLLAAGLSPDHLPWFAAFAGAGMMLAVAALAARRWGVPAGAVAGVVAGALPLSVYYGHHVLAEADAMAGLAVALYFWDRFWLNPAPRLAIGTLAACLVTVTINYRFFPTVVPLIATVAWRYFDRSRAGGSWRWRIALTCFLPSVALILIYLSLSVATQVLHLQRLPWQITMLTRGGSDSPTLFSFPDFYIRSLWEFGGGAVMIAILALGVFAALQRHLRDGDLLMLAAGCLCGTLLFFTAVHDKAPRVAVATIPFAALIAARGMTLWRRASLQWAAAVLACVAVLLAGWTGSSAAREPGGIGIAARWLAAHPGKIVVDRPPTVELYVRGDSRSVRAPTGFAAISELRAAGVRWVVVDANTWVLPSSAVSRQLTVCGTPAAQFGDPASWTRLWFLDGADTLHLGYEGTLAVRGHALAANRGAMAIQIYDLEAPETAACS